MMFVLESDFDIDILFDEPLSSKIIQDHSRYLRRFLWIETNLLASAFSDILVIFSLETGTFFKRTPII